MEERHSKFDRDVLQDASLHLTMSRAAYAIHNKSKYALIVSANQELMIKQGGEKAKFGSEFRTLASLPLQGEDVTKAGIFIWDDRSLLCLWQQHTSVYAGIFDIMLLQWVGSNDTVVSKAADLPESYELWEAEVVNQQIYMVGTVQQSVWFCKHNGTPRVIAENGFAPSLVYSSKYKAIHVAYHADYPTSTELLHVRSLNTDKINRGIWHCYSTDFENWLSIHNESETESLAAHGISGFPSITLWNDKPLIVYIADGSKRPDFTDPQYTLKREGAGSSIGYAFYDGVKWKRGAVARSKEVVIRESEPLPSGLSKGRIYPFYEWHTHPVIVLESDGTPRVIWAEETKQYIMWSRWLGNQFGDNHAHYGPIPALRSVISSLRQCETGSIPTCFMMGANLLFDQQPQAMPRAAGGKIFPFVDLLEIHELTGLEHQLNSFDKSLDNPIFSPTFQDTWDRDMVIFPHVLYNPERECWMMYYSGGSYSNKDGWKCGYAESKNGADWIRKPIHLSDHELSQRYSGNHMPFILPFRDEQEPDVSKRYKGYLCLKEGGKPDGFAVSPDGVNWHVDLTINAEINQGLRFTELPVVDYMDPDESEGRKYKIMGRTFHHSGRALGMQTTGDFIHFEDREVILDKHEPYPDSGSVATASSYGYSILESQGGLPYEHQIYYGHSVGKIADLYYLFYAPCTFDCRYQLALAVSRDGWHYTRVKLGQYLVPYGDLGEWDNGIIAGLKPVLYKGKWSFYYGSSGWHHNTDNNGAFPLHRPNWHIGVAALDEHCWAYLHVKAGEDNGKVLTKPIYLGEESHELIIICNEISTEKQIQVELIDEFTGHPIEGYTADMSSVAPVSANSYKVSWAGNNLEAFQNRQVRFSFKLVGSKAKWYAFGFC